MKKILGTLLFIICLFSLISCEETSPQVENIEEEETQKEDESKEGEKQIEYKESIIRYSDFITEDIKYPQMTMFVGDAEIPLYNCKTNFSQSWNAEAPQRMNNSVATFELLGQAEITLKTTFKINGTCTIRPLQAGIKPEIDEENRTITFTISSPGEYTIELRSNRCLHLFVNSYQEFDSYKNEKNVIYFGPGIYDKDTCEYINNDNMFYLSSNTTIYLDYGAIMRCTFYASDKSNIKIVGGGFIDGSTFDRNANTGTKQIPIDFNYCSDITFKGISCLDPAGWCYNLYFCNNITIDNIKIISSRSNGDGISLQSCKDATVTNSFVRTWDDSLVVKNYPLWRDRNNQGSTKNIIFKDCIIWTDLAQSMEIGYETIGEVLENVTFENITVLHNYHKAVISIHNGNNANIKNITYKNITIEDASMGKGDGVNVIFEFSTEFSSTWSTNHTTTSLGFIDFVTLENIKVIDSNNPKVSIRGANDSRSNYDTSVIHYVSNVKFNGVLIGDKLLDSTYSNLEQIKCKDITFTNDISSITGSVISYKDYFEYSNKNIKFEIIK